MNTRIRYSENNGLLTSVKTFQHPTNGARFSVTLNTFGNTFTITDEACEQVVATGEADSLHQLKKNAKLALAELGIPFSEEKRNKSLQQQSA